MVKYYPLENKGIVLIPVLTLTELNTVGKRGKKKMVQKDKTLIAYFKAYTNDLEGTQEEFIWFKEYNTTEYIYCINTIHDNNDENGNELLYICEKATGKILKTAEQFHRENVGY